MFLENISLLNLKKKKKKQRGKLHDSLVSVGLARCQNWARRIDPDLEALHAFCGNSKRNMCFIKWWSERAKTTNLRA